MRLALSGQVGTTLPNFIFHTAMTTSYYDDTKNIKNGIFELGYAIENSSSW